RFGSPPILASLESQPYGEIDCAAGYRGLIALFQKRLEQLQASGEHPQLAGFEAKHFKNFDPVTLGVILGVLALKFQIVVDEKQWSRILPRLTPAKIRRWNRRHASGENTGGKMLASRFNSTTGRAARKRRSAAM